METREKVQFLTIDEFKTKLGKAGREAQVVKNPNTGKLFLAIDDLRFKVQASIDPNKNLAILVPEEGGLEQACLINAKPNTDNLMFTI